MIKLLRIGLPFILLFIRVQRLDAGNPDSLRSLYYLSVDNKEALNEAFNIIHLMRENREGPEALLRVSEGTLIGLKGKHTRSVRKKYDYVMEALPIMESARKADSMNVEILFIQGTTTYYLPFFWTS